MAIPFDTLYAQNHDIGELSKVLGVLIQNREMCDTSVTCELFERYKGKVKNHLEMVDRNLYAPLLSHSNRDYNALASRFLNSSKEIERIFNRYMNKWCANGLHIYNHDTFIAETDEIFQLISERILAETEELYPAARAVEQQSLAATG